MASTSQSSNDNELERLKAENQALKERLQNERDTLTIGGISLSSGFPLPLQFLNELNKAMSNIGFVSDNQAMIFPTTMDKTKKKKIVNDLKCWAVMAVYDWIDKNKIVYLNEAITSFLLPGTREELSALHTKIWGVVKPMCYDHLQGVYMNKYKELLFDEEKDYDAFSTGLAQSLQNKYNKLGLEMETKTWEAILSKPATKKSFLSLFHVIYGIHLCLAPMTLGFSDGFIESQHAVEAIEVTAGNSVLQEGRFVECFAFEFLLFYFILFYFILFLMKATTTKGFFINFKRCKCMLDPFKALLTGCCSCSDIIHVDICFVMTCQDFGCNGDFCLHLSDRETDSMLRADDGHHIVSFSSSIPEQGLYKSVDKTYDPIDWLSFFHPSTDTKTVHQFAESALKKNKGFNFQGAYLQPLSCCLSRFFCCSPSSLLGATFEKGHPTKYKTIKKWFCSEFVTACLQLDSTAIDILHNKNPCDITPAILFKIIVQNKDCFIQIT